MKIPKSNENFNIIEYIEFPKIAYVLAISTVSGNIATWEYSPENSFYWGHYFSKDDIPSAKYDLYKRAYKYAEECAEFLKP